MGKAALFQRELKKKKVQKGKTSLKGSRKETKEENRTSPRAKVEIKLQGGDRDIGHWLLWPILPGSILPRYLISASPCQESALRITERDPEPKGADRATICLE